MENDVYILNGKAYKDYMPGSLKTSFTDAANKLGSSLGWGGSKNYGEKSKQYLNNKYFNNSTINKNNINDINVNKFTDNSEFKTKVGNSLSTAMLAAEIAKKSREEDGRRRFIQRHQVDKSSPSYKINQVQSNPFDNASFLKDATVTKMGGKSVGQNTYYRNNRFMYKDPHTGKIKKGWWKTNVFGKPIIRYDSDTARDGFGNYQWYFPDN